MLTYNVGFIPFSLGTEIVAGDNRRLESQVRSLQPATTSTIDIEWIDLPGSIQAGFMIHYNDDSADLIGPVGDDWLDEWHMFTLVWESFGDHVEGRFYVDEYEMIFTFDDETDGFDADGPFYFGWMSHVPGNLALDALRGYIWHIAVFDGPLCSCQVSDYYDLDICDVCSDCEWNEWINADDMNECYPCLDTCIEGCVRGSDCSM